jgi:hypothetical protein
MGIIPGTGVKFLSLTLLAFYDEIGTVSLSLFLSLSLSLSLSISISP